MYELSKLMTDIKSKVHALHRITYTVNIKETHPVLPETEIRLKASVVGGNTLPLHGNTIRSPRRVFVINQTRNNTKVTCGKHWYKQTNTCISKSPIQNANSN